MRSSGCLMCSVYFFICLHEVKLQDVDDSSQDIFTMLSTSNCTKFKSLIVAAGHQTEDFYKRAPSLTVFAPNDAAFDQMSPARRQKIFTMSPAEKENYVKSYTLPKLLMTSNMNSSLIEESLGGPALTRIFFNRRFTPKASSINGGLSIYVNGALISKPDIQAQNGIIHITDRVLDPIISSKVYGYIRQPNQTTLSISLKFFTEITNYITGDYYPSTISPLQTMKEMTLFVPTDDAIAKIPRGKLEELRSKQPELSRVIKQHVIPGKAVYTSFVDNMESYSCLYGRVTVFKNGESVSVTAGDVQAEITRGNTTLSNGVIHLVDNVLGFVYNSAQEQLQQDARLSQFNHLLKSGQSDIQNFLIQPFGVTLFAPVNEAFEAIKDMPGTDFNNQTFYNFILHLHMLVEGTSLQLVKVGDYQSRLETRTQDRDRNVKIYQQGNDIWAEGGYVKARVIRPNVGVTNGLVHYIDAVFGVPSRDVLGIMSCEDSLMQASHLFSFAGLNDFLKDVRIHKPLPHCRSGRFSNYTKYNDSDSDDTSNCNATASKTLLIDRCGDSNKPCHFTVFVPNGTAVDDFLKKSYGRELFKNVDKLRYILQRHIAINNTIYIDQLSHGHHDFVTANGDIIRLIKQTDYYAEIIFSNMRARIIHSDLGATNGVIHIIDGILFTPEDVTNNSCNDTDNSHVFTTGQKQGTVQVNLYKDSSFQTHITDTKDNIQIGETVFVQVTVPNNDSLILILNFCHVDFTRDSGSLFSGLLISHGCPVGKGTQMLESRNQETRFKFDVLTLPHPSNGMKVTCDVRFCSKSDFSPRCHLGCLTDLLPAIIGK